LENLFIKLQIGVCERLREAVFRSVVNNNIDIEFADSGELSGFFKQTFLSHLLGYFIFTTIFYW